MSLCSCGHSLGTADRFCPRCGTAAVDQTSAADQASAAGQILSGPSIGSAADGPESDGAILLSVNDTETSVQSTSEVRSSHRGPWLVVGAVILIGLAWTLFARPGSDTSAEGGQSEQEAAALEDADDEDPDDEDPDQSSDSTDTTESTDDTNDSGNTDNDDREDQSVSSTDLSGEAAEDPEAVVAGEPIVGEPTGLWLAVGSYDFNRSIDLVDLDTGTVYETDVRGIPVGVIGTHLVYDTTDGSISVLDLGTPEAEPVRLGSEAGYVGFGSVSNDLIWLSLPEDNEDVLLRGYTVDGELVEELPFGFAPFFSSWNGDSNLIYDIAGGVFEKSGDGYSRVSTGFLQAAGPTIALIRECDDDFDCESRWFRRSDWEPLPYPEPPFEAQAARTELAGQERLLVQTTWNGRGSVVDIESGVTLRELGGGNVGPWTVPILSDDGRWLYEPSGGSPVLVDLRTKEEWPLELASREYPSAVFIDLEASPYGKED